MPHILLYDGVCGFCNRFVQFILRRDRHAIFRFASLQSPLASRILARHNLNPSDLDTVYVVVNPESENANELLLARSDAALFVLKHLGAPWPAAVSLLQLLPKFLLNSAYNAIARHRYRIFGRSETCPLPSAQDRNRFLDL
ncbi:MAG: DCC1-like thiol-disulfide oxidoreductase family protein [Candidatus Sulfotelmatobacter sp.]|jgi:predicted DCC family thiol-disulfide oxidoreductase YuxK